MQHLDLEIIMQSQTLSSSKKYKSLRSHLEKIALLHSVEGLLDWDLKTYIPAKATSSRGAQQALISEIKHKMVTSKGYARKLEALIDLDSGLVKDPSLPPEVQSALIVLHRDFIQNKKLPISFVKQFTEVSSRAYPIWAEAKKANDFNAFSPLLEEIVGLCRRKADYLGYKDHPYDALVDIYEPEMTAAQLKPLFTELQKGLSDLFRLIDPVDTSCLEGEFSREGQLKLSREILEMVGLSSDYCRLDESAHPFCTSFHPTDVRLTTRVLTNDVMSCLGSVLHEAGHGLYEHQLPTEHFATPLGSYCSLAIHESQSRFFEVFLGKSEAFWRYFYPKLQQAFSSNFSSVDFKRFYKAIHRVKPTFIRVESDEVTYNLHIIVRFECEMALLDGSLKVKDVPDFWNDKTEKYLGTRPNSYATGCLQDVHWSCGGIGYFPTYTLGNMAAATLFKQFKKECSNWEIDLEKGDMHSAREFLYDKIHRHGRQGSSQELLKKATGKGFVAKDLLDYLHEKYKSIAH